jgi:hypothetical protein
MALSPSNLSVSRFKISASILAVLLVAASMMLPSAASGEGSVLCCSDDWQVAGICPPGDVIASYCTDSSCQSCGPTFCFTPSPRQQCFQ